MKEGKIVGVKFHSPAAVAGIKPGDVLLGVNGRQVRDIIEYSYAQCEEQVEVRLLRQGQEVTLRVAKDPDEDLGLEFGAAVFDGVKLCANCCKFCFVHQMIPGMRSGLYVRDDDYRLSFLYGNFVTLTNMQEEDWQRIFRLHLSPLYVSVHATDSTVRCNLMQNPQAGEVLSRIKRLIEGGIQVHTQIVCCPGYNDGEVLERTFRDLANLYPGVLTMAVVPVGLTKHREHLPFMRTFTGEEARIMCRQAQKWQGECRQKWGRSFIYLGDEFYLLAGEPLPKAEVYDGFPQLENGIGLTRVFVDDWQRYSVRAAAKKPSEPAVIPVGEGAYPVLRPLMEKLNAQNGGGHQFLSVPNTFFGGAVNVTGLLSGQDLLRAVQGAGRVILPAVTLNKDQVFLDDMSYDEFCRGQGGRVQVAAGAKELLELLV